LIRVRFTGTMLCRDVMPGNETCNREAAMQGKTFLAFDLGAESGRAVLGTLDGGHLKLEEKHRFANPTGTMLGRLQWNLLQQWEELKTGLRAATAGGKMLDGIGVDTWGVDYGLVADDGSILGNPFHYRDTRTDGMMEKVFAQIPRSRIFEITGIQFMQLNTLFQLAAMREAQPSLLKQAHTLLFMPDLLNYLFTGQRKSEYSIASTSQLLDARKREWSGELFDALSLPMEMMPEIVPSGTVIGSLHPHLARTLECGEAPVIAPGCHDTASAVASVPASGDGWCYISSGTWSLMGVEQDKPLINKKSLAYNYTNEGGVGGKIRLLKNIMGMWLIQECRRQFRKDGYDHSYSELTQMAGRAEAFGPLIDPSHASFVTPGEMPSKIADFCRATGQRGISSRGEFVRCCMESLALTYRRTLEGLEDLLGRKLETIHIVGGGTQNELLNQMTADACGREVVAGPIEATAIGNILVQAMAVGEVKSLAEARQIVANSFPVKRYAPAHAAAWDGAYERYLAIADSSAHAG
jgi:rhamnulokinase